MHGGLQVSFSGPFLFSLVGDGPAVLGVGLQPGVGEEGVEGGSAGQVGQDGFEPGPGFDGTGFAAGDEAHEDGGAVAGLGAAHEQW